MGRACPVCGDPQADAAHLANHLAITALARGGDHEAWLDETVPDWEHTTPEELGDEVVEYAPETDHEIPSEGHDHEPGRPAGRLEDALRFQSAGRGRAALDDETASALAEAREFTARMLDDRDEGSDEGS